jgi:hypothetical protein
VRIWLGKNVCHCLVDCAHDQHLRIERSRKLSLTTVDSVGLLVWNLNAELFLDGHHHLYCVQAVQAQVVLEMRGGANLEGSVRETTRILRRASTLFASVTCGVSVNVEE